VNELGDQSTKPSQWIQNRCKKYEVWNFWVACAPQPKIRI